MNVKRFMEQVQSVVDWNATARMGEFSFDPESFANQKSYTESEIYETIAGFASDDVVETLDGIADIFVTLSYLWYMNFKGNISEIKPFTYNIHVEPLNKHEISQFLVDILYSVDRSSMELPDRVSLEYSMRSLYLLMQDFEKRYDVDMHTIVDEVMKSNWSKYPESELLTIDDADDECTWIEATRGKDNVAPILYNGRWVFRDKNGSGKIMKPSTFVEPDIAQYLQQS